MIKMVVFDMAGTTIDEDNVVYKTLQKAISQAGYNVSLDQVLLLGAGKEKFQAIKDILSSLNGKNHVEEKAPIIFSNFKTMLKAAYNELDVKTFKGTEQVFDYLHKKDVKVILNTGYNKATAISLLNKLNWEQGNQYDLLVTADDVQKGRPHPDMILLAMKKMTIADPASVIKIGDSAIDIEEGKAAGCGLTLGVTTGAQTAEQLEVANPTHIIDSLNYLKELI